MYNDTVLIFVLSAGLAGIITALVIIGHKLEPVRECATHTQASERSGSLILESQTVNAGEVFTTEQPRRTHLETFPGKS